MRFEAYCVFFSQKINGIFKWYKIEKLQGQLRRSLLKFILNFTEASETKNVNLILIVI